MKSKHVFLNVPFDVQFEPLYVALIASLTAYELVPRTVLEIPPDEDRLDRLARLVKECGHSVHDLSRVTIEGSPPVPRFNMPFELGLALGIHGANKRHRWIIFEETRHRLGRSLSDLSGYDIEVHNGEPDGVLQGIRSRLVHNKPLIRHEDLRILHAALAAGARRVKSDCGDLFSNAGFRELVAMGQRQADEHFSQVAAATRSPVPEAGDGDWVGMLCSLAQAKGIEASEQEVSNAVSSRLALDRRAFLDLLLKIDAFYTDIGELYVADINNDGRTEYVVCDTNSVGLHNNNIAGIFTPYNGVMVPVALPKRVPFQKENTVMYFARPFLTIADDGTVIVNFSEGVGSKEKRAAYVWSGGHIRLVERVPAKQE